MPRSEPLLVITNADAGTADDEALADALEVLRAHTSVDVYATSAPGELDGALHRAASRQIVVAGGDGSLHTVVSALYRRRELANHVLGLLPLGTGNDFARTLGIPLDPAEAARCLVEGEIAELDLLVDEVGEIAVNSVHLGAGADASKRAVRWKSRLGSLGVGRLNLGRLGYPIGAVITGLRPPTLRLRVEVDGKVVADVDEPVLMVALGNGATVGGGTELTPDADPADGLIDVLVATPASTLARAGYAVRLPFGAHEAREDVRTVRGSTVSVSGSAFWCSADGEVYGPERHRTWHLERAAYRMVLPRRDESGAP